MSRPRPTDRPGVPVTATRRAVLLGGLGTAALLASGCGLDDRGGTRLVALFDPRRGVLITDVPQRITLGLADADGTLRPSGPDALAVRILDDNGLEVAAVEARRHDAGLPHPYYPVTFTPPRASHYRATTTVDGDELTLSFVVGTRRDAALLHVGDVVPATRTPTADDAAGVSPICSLDPPCPLHATSLADDLGRGPIALLVDSPGHCAGPVCWPVVELLVAAAPDHPAVTALHAEAYRDADLVADLADALPSPAASALGLTFAPSLVLIGRDGTIVERLDHVVDAVELDEALSRLAAR